MPAAMSEQKRLTQPEADVGRSGKRAQTYMIMHGFIVVVTVTQDAAASRSIDLGFFELFVRVIVHSHDH